MESAEAAELCFMNRRKCFVYAHQRGGGSEGKVIRELQGPFLLHVHHLCSSIFSNKNHCKLDSLRFRQQSPAGPTTAVIGQRYITRDTDTPLPD